MALLKNGDLITKLCRLLYFTRLELTVPGKLKLVDNARLIFWPCAMVNALANSVLEQLITAAKLLKEYPNLKDYKFKEEYQILYNRHLVLWTAHD